MSDIRTAALTAETQAARPFSPSVWTAVVLQAGSHAVSATGAWAVSTAQQFGSLVSALMAPAVFSAYSFAAWSLSANLGWTSSFPYASGPLSNWLIWAGIAAGVHMAAQVLKKLASGN